MFALKEAARHLPRWFDWYRLGRLVRYLCDTGSYAMHLQHSVLVHSLQPRHLFVHSFQSRHRHSIVMTLHMHVGPGLESFVRKTSFVFIVAILR